MQQELLQCKSSTDRSNRSCAERAELLPPGLVLRVAVRHTCVRRDEALGAPVVDLQASMQASGASTLTKHLLRIPRLAASWCLGWLLVLW